MNNEREILTEDQTKEALQSFSGWRYDDGRISKEFLFVDFLDAINFIDKLAPICQEINHHPDIFIYYNKIRFEITTHSAGNKITDIDINLVKKIEELFKKFS